MPSGMSDRTCDQRSAGTAVMAWQTIKAGKVAVAGSTGSVLSRSLSGLRDLINSSLSEVRLEAGIARRERISLNQFEDEIAAAANLQAEDREVRLTVQRADPELADTMNCSVPLGIGACRIVQVSASGCRSVEGPSRRAAVTSARTTSLGRAASSPSTCRQPPSR